MIFYCFISFVASINRLSRQHSLDINPCFMSYKSYFSLDLRVFINISPKNIIYCFLLVVHFLVSFSLIQYVCYSLVTEFSEFFYIQQRQLWSCPWPCSWLILNFFYHLIKVYHIIPEVAHFSCQILQLQL